MKREIVEEVYKYLEATTNLLAVVGGPLSGKTNVAYQICTTSKTHGYIPYYIDYASESCGIIRTLTNSLAEEFFFHMTPEEVKSWLLNGHDKNQSEKMLFVIDGISPENIKSLKSELEELHSISKKSGYLIVFLCDDNSYKYLSIIPGRKQKTKLGNSSIKLKLKNLNREEFRYALEYFYKEFRLSFAKGGELNLDYRSPRLLRTIAWIRGETGKEPRQIAYFPAVTTTEVIWQAWTQFKADEEFISDYQSLASAFVKEQTDGLLKGAVGFQCYGTGRISLQFAEKTVGVIRIERLCKTGLAKKVLAIDGSILLQPTLPELISVAAIFQIKSDIFKHLECENYNEAYEVLIKESEPLPYGELAAVLAIFDINSTHPEAFNKFIYKLFEDKPTKSLLKKGAIVAINLPDYGVREFKFCGEKNETTLSNLHPWMLLSCLLGKPSFIRDSGLKLYIGLLASVASYPAVLKKPDVANFKKSEGFHIHDIDGAELLCGSSGIIEYITHAITIFLLHLPEEFAGLVDLALAKNANLSLVNRVYLSLNFHKDRSNSKVQAAIESYLPDIKQKFDDLIKKSNWHREKEQDELHTL